MDLYLPTRPAPVDAEGRTYTERQAAHRARALAAPQEDRPTTGSLAALLTPEMVAAPCDALDLHDAASALARLPYRRQALAVSPQEVRSTAAAILPGLLAAGFAPEDAAKVALHRADRRALSDAIRAKDAAAGNGHEDDSNPESADALALALAAVEDDPGADWLPVARTPRPDALRIVEPLSPEDAHALAVDTLPPLGRRILAATLAANEGADPRALTHRRTCRKPAPKPSACCRRDVIAPALRTSVVALAVHGSTSGPARTRTKRDQQEYGTDYHQQAATARRARTEADAAAWTDHADQTRAAVLLRLSSSTYRVTSRGTVQPATVWQAKGEQPEHRTERQDRPWTTASGDALPWTVLASVLDRQAKERPAGDLPISKGTKESDLPDWAVMPDTRATPVRFTAPDPEHLSSEARLAGTEGYDLSKSDQQAADKAAAAERHAQDMDRGNDAARLAKATQRADKKEAAQAALPRNARGEIRPEDVEREARRLARLATPEQVPSLPGQPADLPLDAASVQADAARRAARRVALAAWAERESFLRQQSTSRLHG